MIFKARKNSGIKRASSQAGFSLLECLFAIMITAIGLVAVEMLIINGITTQTLSGNAGVANELAKAKMEELQSIGSGSSKRTVGGSLTSNVANHYDTSNSQFTVRWVVAAGAVGTQDVTIAVVPAVQGTQIPTTQIETLLQ